MDEDTVCLLGASVLTVTFLACIITIFQFAASFITVGKGQYVGTIIDTQQNGIIIPTYGVELKTGENSSQLDSFCVLDKRLFEKISSIPRNKRVLVSYKKKLSTTVWQCDTSNRIATAVSLGD